MNQIAPKLASTAFNHAVRKLLKVDVIAILTIIEIRKDSVCITKIVMWIHCQPANAHIVPKNKHFWLFHRVYWVNFFELITHGSFLHLVKFSNKLRIVVNAPNLRINLELNLAWRINLEPDFSIHFFGKKFDIFLDFFGKNYA